MLACSNIRHKFKPYINRQCFAIFLLCVAEGVPISLLASTFTVWLYDAGIDKTAIGFVALSWLPYTVKFLWAPLLDVISIPILTPRFGRQRSWMIVVTILQALAIYKLAHTDPLTNLMHTAIWATITAACSATHDILINAFRVNLLSKDQQSTGAVPASFGHRMGMILTGAGALLLSRHMSWNIVYEILSLTPLLALVSIAISGEPKYSRKIEPWISREAKKFNSLPEKIRYIVKQVTAKPFGEFMSKDHYKAVLLFIISFKLTYEFINHMTMPFLLELGYSKLEITAVDKLIGAYIAVTGSLLGPMIVIRYGMFNALAFSLIIQSCASIGFLIQYYVQYDISVLMLTVGLEKLCSGISRGVLVAFIGMSCSNTKYTSTQYAIILSLTMICKVTVATPSGWVADTFGWVVFFLIGVALTFPGLTLLNKYRNSICTNTLEKDDD